MRIVAQRVFIHPRCDRIAISGLPRSSRLIRYLSTRRHLQFYNNGLRIIAEPVPRLGRLHYNEASRLCVRVPVFQGSLYEMLALFIYPALFSSIFEDG